VATSATLLRPVAAPEPRPARLLEAADYGRIALLMAIGLALRLPWYSGWGLGDDENFRALITSIVYDGIVPTGGYSYRFTWWVPTAISCRVFGVTETGMMVPITAMFTLGIGLVYAFAKSLWGRTAGTIAALLLIVHPLDFAWSTMLANDVYPSFFSALSVLLYLRAIETDDPAAQRWRWALSGTSLVLAFYAKLSALALLPALAVMAWWHRDRLSRTFVWFVGMTGFLLGLGALASLAITGSPIGPYHAEMAAAGLNDPSAIQIHRLTWEIFLRYPRWLFWTDHLGGMLYSAYPQLIALFALLALLAPRLGLRTSRDVFVWFLAVFLPMQLQMTRVNGVWVSMFRNIRHSHGLVYPVVLLLTGYLVSLRARHARGADALVAVLFGFSLIMSMKVAAPTRASFGDERALAYYLATLPPKTVYSDSQLALWYALLGRPPEWLPFKVLPDKASERWNELGRIRSGYVVTGGGREPYYGCGYCIPQASELPPGRFRLLREFPGPQVGTPWRRDRARVWEAIEGG